MSQHQLKKNTLNLHIIIVFSSCPLTYAILKIIWYKFETLKKKLYITIFDNNIYFYLRVKKYTNHTLYLLFQSIV